MRKSDIMKIVDERLTSDHHFVKWWRKENDFLDFDLINHFLENLTTSDEIGGFDLLTMDEMWSEVQKVSGDKVKRIQSDDREVLGWIHDGKEGLKSYTCEFSPENLLKIFDVETKGNPVH